ncbi:MAG: MBOAT family protein [Clostridiales Family XIII bacterium]|jgi:alginate O-acetyltransferase complex protein AlgI|nr:MBOAT family protein [Clostridiales Family XIII bacterium]
MVFSSLVFLGLFLPAVLLAYYATLRATGSFRIVNRILLAGSLFFYSWGEPLWIVAMLFTSSVDYVNGRRIGSARSRGGAKLILISSIAINLGILFVFKYIGFAIGTLNALPGPDLPEFSLEMPIGISFYTFQSLSYIIDLYRGRTAVQRSYFNYLLYVSMFPQLVAGPIVRYMDIERQIESREVTFGDFGAGAKRFCVGLGKKVLLANSAGAGAGALLDGDLASAAPAAVWLGVIFYTFQIYFDFSGYSDMAIGLGRMFGFRYNENFRYPYISSSITEFWRRWHISLGGFFRDYLYIPLGGNRRLQLRNILVVWFLTGLWHGASWNFIAWGLYYGLLLILEKNLAGFTGRVPLPVKWLVTMLIVIYGWGIFYFVDAGRLAQFSGAFFFLNGVSGVDMKTASVFFQYFWLFPVFAVGSTPLPRLMMERLSLGLGAGAELFKAVLVAASLAACFLLLAGESYNPFLYFRF